MGRIGLDVRLWFAALAVSAAAWGTALAVEEASKEPGGPPVMSPRVERTGETP
jgi:hypothetical protein